MSSDLRSLRGYLGSNKLLTIVIPRLLLFVGANILGY